MREKVMVSIDISEVAFSLRMPMMAFKRGEL